jgi:hypothetical protein
VYVGESAENDGAEVFLDEDGMDESVNADLMLNGHVYIRPSTLGEPALPLKRRSEPVSGDPII